MQNLIFLILGILIGWAISDQLNKNLNLNDSINIPIIPQSAKNIAQKIREQKQLLLQLQDKIIINQEATESIQVKKIRELLVVKVIKKPELIKKIVSIMPVITRLDSDLVKPSIDIYTPSFLMNKSNKLIQQKAYKKALFSIENLLAQVQDEYSTEIIEEIFISTANKYLAQIGENNIQKKIDVLNEMIYTLPNYLGFHFSLAKLLLSIDNYTGATYQIDFLANNINWKKQFDKVQSQINYAQIFGQGDIAIPLIRLKNSWHIDVTINNAQARLILDTGASITTISNHLIASDYKRLTNVILSTANGKIKAFKVNIDTFKVGSVSKNNFSVVVLPREKLPANIDGLLGLDWLANFNFIIDKQNAILRLTPIIN